MISRSTYSVGGVDKTLRVVRVDDPANCRSTISMPMARASSAWIFRAARRASRSALASNARARASRVIGQRHVADRARRWRGGHDRRRRLVGHATASGLQNGELALNLFVDRSNSAFTDSLDGKGRSSALRRRISVNSAVLTDNTLLVQYQRRRLDGRCGARQLHCSTSCSTHELCDGADEPVGPRQLPARRQRSATSSRRR